MKKTITLLAVCLALAGSASVAAPMAQAAPLSVFVSIPPQAYFVQRIGGDRVAVSIMVPPGADPHVYEPKPQQMVALSQAKVYFAVGITFEDAWLEKITAANPELTIVHTDEGIAKIPMVAHHHEEGEHHDADEAEHHDGEEQGDHEDHGTLDPHVWTSPREVMAMAAHIRDGLIAADPDGKAAYEAGYAGFMDELAELDATLKAVFEPHPGLKFMVYHPAWGYLAHDYGLVQMPVEIGGREPKPAQLAALIAEARKEGIRVVFVQPQVSRRAAEVIAREINGRVVPADPLSADWAANLLEIASAFKASTGEK